MAAGTGRPGRRIALTLHYDGTGFNGWQIQAEGRTVQGEVEYALEVLTRKTTRVVASGRTDTGVHALGQVVHFDTTAALSLRRICNGLNGILARDVSVINAFVVSPSFHARFDAIEREYRYLIYNHPQRSPFMKDRAMWAYYPLDIDYLREVCGHFIGELDFASFCKKKDAELMSTIRTIKAITITSNNDLIEITIIGNAFLHNMIRIMIGTITEMFRSGDVPERIPEILDKKDRQAAGPTAPPCGLYLKRVTYDPALSAGESAF